MSWIQQLQNTNWPDWSQTLGVSFCAYVLGCFTVGYYLVRLRMGVDIRELGSGCVGAKNVGRVLGRTGFLLTALGDFGKGALAVWAAHHFSTDNKLAAIALLAVVVGHVWPVQLWFRGGKGVSTLLGALLVYDYHQALFFAALFACGFLILRKTVLPGLLGVACLPLADYYFKRDPASTVIISISAALVLFAHRKNIMEEVLHLTEHHDDHPQPDHS